MLRRRRGTGERGGTLLQAGLGKGGGGEGAGAGAGNGGGSIVEREGAGLLTPELLDELRSAAGLELLRRAAAYREDPFAAEKLRGGARLELAAAAVEQVRLRARAAAKFARAAEMWFSPSLLEQASGDVIARYRAARFAREADGAAEVGDFCAGLGGDALALAEHTRVVAVDRDALARALVRANAETLGRAARVEVRAGELPRDAPSMRRAWVDPGRREGGRRTRRLDEMSPTLEEILSLRSRIKGLGVKLSPAADHAELDALLGGVAHQREFLSVHGECRELALWLGELSREGGEPAASRRATLLPAGQVLAGEPEPLREIRAPGEWLLEPDGAVVRAGLVGNLAERLGAWGVDLHLAYLSHDRRPATPFATVYRVGEAEPFSGKRLAARLRALGASDVVLKTRGAAVKPEILRQQLRAVLKQGRPDCRPVVFLTRFEHRPVMMLGECVGSGTH